MVNTSKLMKISDDVGIDLPHKGSYRHTNKTVLHGIYIRNHSNTQDKLYINNGHLMRKYTYPIIQRKFHSPMVNDYNLHLCGGWAWPSVERIETIHRVISKLKPMGSYTIWDKDEDIKNQTMKIVLDSGLPHNFKKREKYFDIDICQSGILDELFDMDSLCEDYISYGMLSKWKPKNGEIESIIESLRRKTLSDFLNVDYVNPSNLAETISTGLILGYPIESTVSIVFMEKSI